MSLDMLRKGGVRLSEIDFLADSTTAVINTLTERKGATRASATPSRCAPTRATACSRRNAPVRCTASKPEEEEPEMADGGRLLMYLNPVGTPDYDEVFPAMARTVKLPGTEVHVTSLKPADGAYHRAEPTQATNY